MSEAHEVFLPHDEAVEPADALVDGAGPDGLVGRAVEVEQGVVALDGEELVLGRGEEGTVVFVALARDVVIAVDGAALDVDGDVGPLVEGLGHGLGVGGVEDVVEGVGDAVDDVQAFL